MGAWHHDPYENDSALDWMGPIEDYIVRRAVQAVNYVRRARKPAYGYHEAIAGAQLLVDLSNVKRKPNISYRAYELGAYEKARAAIKNIQEDASWIAEWSEPKKVSAMLQTLNSQLGLCEKREKRCHERAMARLVPMKKRRKAA